MEHIAIVADQRHGMIGDGLGFFGGLRRIEHVRKSHPGSPAFSYRSSPAQAFAVSTRSDALIDALARNSSVLDRADDGANGCVGIGRHQQHIRAGFDRAHRSFATVELHCAGPPCPSRR